MATTFLSLPVEIQRQCINYLDSATLKSTRLSLRDLKEIATEALFETATVELTRESQERFTGLLQDNALRRYVRQINLDARCEQECYDDECFLDLPSYWWKEACSEWGTVALPTLKKLVLDGAYACADNHCSALTLALKSFMSAADVEAVTIRHLRDDSQFEQPDFAQLATKLNKLHLLITTWCDDASYDYELDLHHRHEFFNVHLNKTWLDPLQDHLTHLSLHCNTYWGVYPRWHPGSLHFPHLRSMSIAQWTIAYDWQLDFITSHGQTLEQLLLTNCPILHALCMTTRQANNRWQQPLGGTGRGKPPTSNTFSDLRWHNILPKLANELPKLKYFSMGRGPTRGADWGHERFDADEGFEDRYKLAPSVDLQRYAIFAYNGGVTEFEKPRPERGLLYEEYSSLSRWLKRETDESVRQRIHYPDCLQEDQDALQGLFDTVRGRW